MSINQNFPNVWASLVLDFENSKTLDPRITFTRSSTATYVGSDGLIKTAAADEARFDHDPVTGESLGLLIEEQRTKIRNGVTYPLGSLSATSSTDITAPDGTTSGIIKITSPSFTNTIGFQQKSVDTSYFAHDVGQNVYYTSSVYVYATGNTDSSRKVFLGSAGGGCLDFPGGPQLTSCGYIDGKDTIQSSTNFTVTLPKNRWVRVFLNWRSGCTSAAYRSAAQVRVLYWITSNEQNTNFINSDGNPVMYLWGATVETNYSTSVESFPTSYIYGNYVTRQPDNAQITGTNFTDWYNDTEGTIFTAFNNMQNSYDTLWAIGEVSATIRRIVYEKNKIIIRTDSGGGSTVLNHTLSNSNKSSVSYNSTEKKVYESLNGSSVLSSATHSESWITASGFQIGSQQFIAAQLANTHIKQLLYYPTRLTDTQLQALTQ